MGIGQVQTVASAVARRTRATAETAVSTIWSVCGRLWRFAYAFRTRAVAEAVTDVEVIDAVGVRAILDLPVRAASAGFDERGAGQGQGNARAAQKHRALH